MEIKLEGKENGDREWSKGMHNYGEWKETTTCF